MKSKFGAIKNKADMTQEEKDILEDFTRKALLVRHELVMQLKRLPFSYKNIFFQTKGKHSSSELFGRF